MSSASSSSSDGRGSVQFPSTESPILLPNETCYDMPSPYTPGCTVPRSCRSCLQRSGCFISSGGYCNDQVQLANGGYFNYGADYRDAFKYNVVLPNATNATALSEAYFDWSFRSLEAKYCPVDDATCITCKENNFYSTTGWTDNRFCVGANGCVCIMACEVAAHYGEYCSSSLPYDSQVEQPPLPTKVVVTVIGIAAGLLGLMVCFRVIRRGSRANATSSVTRQQERQAQREIARQRRVEARGIGLMSLTGWNTYRKDLIDKENLQLSSTSAPYVAVPATPLTENPPARSDVEVPIDESVVESRV